MKEKNVKTKTPNKKALGLTTKIFIALLAGAILGIVLCYLVPDSSFKKDVIVEGILYVVGQGFIRLMKMLVVPLVFCSLVCGSMAIGDTKKLGTVGVRTLVFYLFTTALAVVVALSVGNLINPGVGLDMSAIQTSAASVETMEATSLTDTILNIIPDNPINSLASGTMLQVIVFALIVGVILAKMGERAETVANFFSQFNDIMMEMTMMIMSLAPIGVFCLISRTFANIGFSAFIPLAKYMIGVLLALDCQCKQYTDHIFYPAGKIYDRCTACTGNPVFRSISDSSEDFYRPESGSLYQEILPGYGICILNSDIQRNHPAFY